MMILLRRPTIPTFSLWPNFRHRFRQRHQNRISYIATATFTICSKRIRMNSKSFADSFHNSSIHQMSSTSLSYAQLFSSWRAVHIHPDFMKRFFSVESSFVGDSDVDAVTNVNCVTVTHNLSANDQNENNNKKSSSIHKIKEVFIQSNPETKKLVSNLLERTNSMMDPTGVNIVAFSGGVDSSLVAALVHRCFGEYWNNSATNAGLPQPGGQMQGSISAVIGISNAVPFSQILMARNVAQSIGIPLQEVCTLEGNDEIYVQNNGQACFVCKTHLYSTLKRLTIALMKEHGDSQQTLQQQRQQVIIFNGTNADDVKDKTRVGLLAASNFHVRSPIDQITKQEVRKAAQYLNLPNWDAAASPCLRSRLAMGVEATERHLKAVEKAEEFVKRVLMLDETRNLRVRMLAGGIAMVELDHVDKDSTSTKDDEMVLKENGFVDLVNELGFKSFGGIRRFATGSVAAIAAKNKLPKVKRDIDG